jgi:hypothetical protein
MDPSMSQPTRNHAAGVATAHGIEMSSHLMPEISNHLLCATPAAHWLECVDWADGMIEEPLKIRDGMVEIQDYRRRDPVSTVHCSDFGNRSCRPTAIRMRENGTTCEPSDVNRLADGNQVVR